MIETNIKEKYIIQEKYISAKRELEQVLKREDCLVNAHFY